MIEKIVSPNKQKNSSSSSASSSKNTSPQLPIFSSTAPISGQLVTTINSSSKLIDSAPKSTESNQTDRNSTAPSPFVDNEYKESGGITFTLSDDEIGEDSNQSNYNMHDVIPRVDTKAAPSQSKTEQPAIEKSEAKVVVESKKEEDISSGFQSLSNSLSEEHALKSTTSEPENLFKQNTPVKTISKPIEKQKETLPFSESKTESVNLNTSNENSTVPRTTPTKSKSSILITKIEPSVNSKSNLSDSKMNKIAITGENFKQPKPENLSNFKATNGK